jgi:RNA polymerase sigma-70 factor (ECF subfamily)
MTETQLVQAAREGDRDAVRQLYDRYAPRVFAVVRRIAGDDELARDFAQEAWLRAIRALPTFRGDSRFSTWLHRIAVNAALEAARKADVRERREVMAPDPVDDGGSSADPLLARRLEAALARLPSGMREVLVLHDVEQYTHEEIAEVLGITAGTSKSQLFKARAKMREILRGVGRDGAAGAAGAGEGRVPAPAVEERDAGGMGGNGVGLMNRTSRGLGSPDDWKYEGAEA